LVNIDGTQGQQGRQQQQGTGAPEGAAEGAGSGLVQPVAQQPGQQQGAAADTGQDRPQGIGFTDVADTSWCRSGSRRQ